jgi:hypothetical protein
MLDDAGARSPSNHGVKGNDLFVRKLKLERVLPRNGFTSFAADAAHWSLSAGLRVDISTHVPVPISPVLRNLSKRTQTRACPRTSRYEVDTRPDAVLFVLNTVALLRNPFAHFLAAFLESRAKLFLCCNSEPRTDWPFLGISGASHLLVKLFRKSRVDPFHCQMV